MIARYATSGKTTQTQAIDRISNSPSKPGRLLSIVFGQSATGDLPDHKATPAADTWPASEILAQNQLAARCYQQFVALPDAARTPALVTERVPHSLSSVACFSWGTAWIVNDVAVAPLSWIV